MAFLYQELAHSFIQKIKLQKLTTHSKLPSLRHFSHQHQISLSTAQACYHQLESLGYIYAKKKSGYFVSPQNIPTIIATKKIQQIPTPLGAIQLGAKLIPIEPLRKSIQRALKHSHAEDFLYCDQQGDHKLREALSLQWIDSGIYISPHDVFITNGCMAAISLAIQALSNPYDSIIVPTPTFNGQLQLLEDLQRKVIEVPASHQGIDLKQLEYAMQSAKVCLLTANFQNPLGYCLSHQEKKQIALLAEKYKCYIIEDDVYADCGYDIHRPLPIKYWDQAGYVIWVSSISKSISSAYRIGWLCLGQKTQHLAQKFRIKNILVNTPLQLGLTDFIYSGGYKKHIDSLRPKLFQQVQSYIKILQQLCPHLKIEHPQGGYALWVELPKHIDGFALYQFAMHQSISIVPGNVFSENKNYNHFVRINAGHPLTEEVIDALKKLASWINDYCYPIKTIQVV